MRFWNHQTLYKSDDFWRFYSNSRNINEVIFGATLLETTFLFSFLIIATKLRFQNCKNLRFLKRLNLKKKSVQFLPWQRPQRNLVVQPPFVEYKKQFLVDEGYKNNRHLPLYRCFFITGKSLALIIAFLDYSIWLLRTL